LRIRHPLYTKRGMGCVHGVFGYPDTKKPSFNKY